MLGEHPAIASAAPLTIAHCRHNATCPSVSRICQVVQIINRRSVEPIIGQAIKRIIGTAKNGPSGTIVQRILKTGTIVLAFGLPPDIELNAWMRQLCKIKTRAFDVRAFSKIIKRDI